MTIYSIFYYAIIFIISLFMISRLILISSIFQREGEGLKRTFIILCTAFIVWSISVVSVGISQHSVLDVVFLLLSEFMKITTFVAATELFAELTGRNVIKKKSSYTVSAELSYLGIAALVLFTIQNRCEVVHGSFGSYFVSPVNISFILRVLFYIIIVFFLGAYTYMFYYSNDSRREGYISRQCAISVAIVSISLCVETVCYIQFNAFVPSMYIGMLICIFILRDLIIYKRSIEYNEEDYQRILAPSHSKPAFVCDDDGRVVFENTRAFVMRQTYKDEYRGRILSEIFEISDYDRDRLKDSRVTQFFEVYCRYPREPREMLLTVKHNLDKFGAIFSTEVEIEYANSENEDVVVAAGTEKKKKILLNEEVSIEDELNLRTSEIIKLLDKQKMLYENGQRELFELNLRGISKLATVLSLSALVELCDRIEVELSYGEWESLSGMMVDIDRQYATLQMLNM